MKKILFLAISFTILQSSYALKLGQTKVEIDKEFKLMPNPPTAPDDPSMAYYKEDKAKNLKTLWVKYYEGKCIFFAMSFYKKIDKATLNKAISASLGYKVEPQVIRDGVRYSDRAKGLKLEVRKKGLFLVGANDKLMALQFKEAQKKK